MSTGTAHQRLTGSVNNTSASPELRCYCRIVLHSNYCHYPCCCCYQYYCFQKYCYFHPSFVVYLDWKLRLHQKRLFRCCFVRCCRRPLHRVLLLLLLRRRCCCYFPTTELQELPCRRRRLRPKTGWKITYFYYNICCDAQKRKEKKISFDNKGSMNVATNSIIQLYNSRRSKQEVCFFEHNDENKSGDHDSACSCS